MDKPKTFGDAPINSGVIFQEDIETGDPVHVYVKMNEELAGTLTLASNTDYVFRVDKSRVIRPNEKIIPIRLKP